MELKGKVALVTGGNGGLGQRICHALAGEGAHIAVAYAASRAPAEEVAATLATSYGVKAAAFACDLACTPAVDGLVAAVMAHFGRLDILVNDAAWNKAIAFTDLEALTPEIWTHILAVNLTGPFLLARAAAAALKGSGHGRVVNITSVAGLSPQGSSIAYAVAKAGLIHLTRCLAVALAPEVLVNSVAPGLLEGTRATANLTPEHIARSAGSALLKKPADKDDCAAMVVTLCRTETMTGQTVVIDSGRVFH
jgi:3-oxoacyl-[acyl-carrier protein] reductase